MKTLFLSLVAMKVECRCTKDAGVQQVVDMKMLCNIILVHGHAFCFRHLMKSVLSQYSCICMHSEIMKAGGSFHSMSS